MLSKILPKKIENPTHIFVVDQFKQKRKISIEEAEALFGIMWLEWGSIPYDIIYPIQTDLIQHPTQEVIDMLEVRYMGESYGWGLFSQNHIPKGTILGLFTGDFSIRENNDTLSSHHLYSFNMPENKLGVIDATKSGNITRFFQDLPKPEDLIGYEAEDPSIISTIAVENVQVVPVQVGQNLETTLFVASQDIPANQIIGSRYTPYYSNFWEDKNHSLFLKNGLPFVFSQKYHGQVTNYYSMQKEKQKHNSSSSSFVQRNSFK